MKKYTCSMITLTVIALVSVNGQSVTEEVSLTALDLKAHPRLWVSEDTLNHLTEKLHSPYLRSAADRILADADWLVDLKPIAQAEVRTNQQGTRLIASHLKCLTSAYVLTRDPKYRAAALRHLEHILTWRHISCEANINTPAERSMFFCLSYGEHAADIALMYDIFRPDITPSEKDVFNRVLDRFYLWQALRAYEHPPWWVNKSWSNWNGVCAGGMGMLALAFYDDRPEIRKLIPFVEKSLSFYFQSYIANGGGNHEGTGYWNYGMHYAVRYLLSYERATGKKHPAFDIPEVGLSLHFPVDFTGINFGDNDGWHPAGFFFLMADRLNQTDAAIRAAAFLMHEIPPAPEKRSRFDRVMSADILYAADTIPSAEKMEALKAQRMKHKQPLARVYEGLGWGALMDDSAFPRLRLAARGGSNRITGHGHMDLLSFKCAVNGEKMIDSQHGWIPSVAFTGRGKDLYSRSAAAKSTLFVDGLSCADDMTCRLTEVVEGDGLLGIRIDATGIYMPRWRRSFIGRLFLQVDNAYWLIVDTAPGHMMESRFHTYATLTAGHESAILQKGRESLAVSFASLGGSVLQLASGTPETPVEQTHLLRWMSQSRSRNSLHVTALNPRPAKLAIALTSDDHGFVITIGDNGTERMIALDAQLRPR